MSSRSGGPLGKGYRKKEKSQKARESLESQEIVVAETIPASRANMTLQASAATSTNSKLMPGMDRTVELDGHTYTLPSFETISTLIYDWPAPKPKFTAGRSMLPLSDHHLRFKMQDDSGQKDSHSFIPPLDEWEMFVADFTLGEDGGQNLRQSRQTCILHEQELGGVREEKREARTDEDELPNKIRLAIFDKLKGRLCGEIWLQPYPTNGALDSKVPSPEAEEREAGARSTTGPSRAARDAPPPSKRSRVSGPSTETASSSITATTSTAAATSKRSRASSPAVGAGEGRITGVYRDRLVGTQPLFDGETEPPGMDRHIAASRTDRDEDKARLQQGETTIARLRDQVQHANVNGVYSAPRPNVSPSFETSCELNQMDMDTSDEGEDGDTVVDA